MKKLKGLFLLVLLCATSYMANASCDGNRYTVFGADPNTIFFESGENCCAGDTFTVTDIATNTVTTITMLTSGPNATCE